MTTATRRRRARASGGLLLLAVGLASIGLLALSDPPASHAADGRTLRVPADFAGIEEAIAASSPGDVILLAPGTYAGDIVVPEDKPGITIRGEDRNTVVFDGQDRARNAIEVEADGVTLENMTAHGFIENGFYWDEVQGYAGRYLTVWNVGRYAIYAIQSRRGVMEHSYASGAGDAAFYIGECNPCDATIRNVIATLSAVGYSGTNAGGNLVVEDSRFENNGTGILPNSFEVGLEPPPQRQATFRRNVVAGTGSVATPRATPLGGFFGIGIGVLGGVGNVVEANTVTGSTRYGIAVFPAVDFERTWLPVDNRVTGNTVTGSGTADIALAAGSGAGNCFEDNRAATLLPADLNGCSAAGEGSGPVAAEIVLAPPQMLKNLPEAPSYASMPAPPAQPSMPLADGAAAPGVGVLAVAIAGIAAAIIALGLVLGLRRRWSGSS